MTTPNANLPAGSPGHPGRPATQSPIPGFSAIDRAAISVVDRYLNGLANGQLAMIQTRINHLSSAQEALAQELADQKIASHNNDRTLWQRLMQEEAQRTQEMNGLRAAFSAAIESSKKDLTAEVTNRANDTTALRNSVTFESGRCTQDFKGLRSQIAKTVAAEINTRTANVQGLWDALAKECNERTEEVTELREEVAVVSEAVKKLVEVKNGGVDGNATSQPRTAVTSQQKNDASKHHNDEVIKGLRKELSTLRTELRREKMIREKMIRILEAVAEQTFNTHETVKSLDARLEIMRDYTLLNLSEGMVPDVPVATEREETGGDAGAAADGQ